jgi:hypothetical protein
MIVVLALALIAGIFLYAMILGAAKKAPKRGGGGVAYLDRTAVTLRWQTIATMAESGPAGLKNAVSEADKLFDHAMKQQNFRGNTMAERLKQAERRLTDRDSVWRAHKLRNALAHDVTFDLVPSQAKGALKDFERGLKDLGAL